MKKQMTRALLVFGLLLALAAAASAQTVRHIAVQVPFDFVAGGRQLPAGRYTVRRYIEGVERVLLIQREDGRYATLVSTDVGEGGSPERVQLKFRAYGGHYFLSEVSLPGAQSVYELPRSRQEKSLLRELKERAKAGDDVAKSVTVAGSVQ